MTRAARVCANPLCQNGTFIPTRVDQHSCDSSCRAEASRIRELLHGQNPVAAAVRAALHKRGQPKKRGSTGSRPATPYIVLEVLERRGLVVMLTLAGLGASHSRGSVVRTVASSRDTGGDLWPIPTRSLVLYGPDGSKLERSLLA